jgi:hypothetical protein
MQLLSSIFVDCWLAEYAPASASSPSPISSVSRACIGSAALAATRMMTVLGGIDAAHGFQVIRFSADGSFQVERFERSMGAYTAEPPFTLWTVHDWRRLEWERESVRLGWYEQVAIRKDFDPFGDVAQSWQTRDIHGPRRSQIENLTYGVNATDGRLGQCVMVRVTDATGNTEPGRGEARVGIKVSWPLSLIPAARENSSHPGFHGETRHLNCFALTAADAKLRGHPATERTEIQVLRPTRLLRLQMRFPPGFGPSGAPQVRAFHAESAASARVENEAETARAKPRLLFESDLGYVFLDLDWVLPSFRYEIEWPLRKDPPETSLDAIRAKEQARSLLKLKRFEADRLGAGLVALRDQVATTRLGLPEDRRSLVELGLWVFDPDKRVGRMAAGTHAAGNPHWNAALPWGVNAQGWVMRRHKPLFLITLESDAEGVYSPLPDHPPDLHILCVPIPLPWPTQDPEELLARRIAHCAGM